MHKNKRRSNFGDVIFYMIMISVFMIFALGFFDQTALGSSPSFLMSVSAGAVCLFISTIFLSLARIFSSRAMR